MTCNKLDKLLKKGVTKMLCTRHQQQERKQSRCDCKKCFESAVELKDAAFRGYSDNALATGLSEVTAIHGPIEHWCVNKINDFSYTFANNNFQAFNNDISRWNTANANFNYNVSKWNVGKVTNMRSMFSYVQTFNSSISRWNVKEVKDMSNMFSNAINFNSDLSKYDVGKATNMGAMFFNAQLFKSSISGWNVKEVTFMRDMFSNAVNFNSNISN
jgi:surface protein